MQNQYNNYLKRQKQQPINNFKEKVRNSLNGKTVNNTTMPNTAQANIQNKVKAMTPTNGTSTNTIGSGSASGVVTPVQTPNNINTKIAPANVLETPLNASEGTPVINTPVEANQNVEGVGGAGLMSLSDVNSALAVTPEATSGYSVNSKARTTNASANQRSLVYNPLDPNAIVPGTGGMTQAEYEAEAKRKLEAGIALDNPELYNKYTSQSTPYKLAEQILQSQKEQADKGWQLQEQMFQQQQDALNKQYEQSKLEAENAYKQSVDTLNEQKYNQMEELNVSGTNRGIQYSPQQLGLENVANINHNKNLVETSNKRNELLNKLQIEMNNSLAQLNMSHLQNYNDYQNKLNGYQTDYYEKLMNWNREDNKEQDSRDWEQKLLEEKRAWEEAQAQKDREFQQMMQDLQNKFDKEQQDSQNSWQSGENALDREHDKTLANMSKSRSGGGYSGYSRRGYSGYSRSYNPYSRGYYGGYQNYDGGSVDLSDDINARAYIATVNEYSDDAFDAYNSLMSPYNAESRASAYRDEIDEMINFAKANGANDDTMRSLYNTRDRAVKQMFENHSGYKNYGGDAIKRGDDKVKFYKKHVTNSLDRMKANQAESVMKRMRNTKKEDKKETSKSNNKSNNTKQNKTVEKVKKSVSNSAKNLKKNTNAKEASKKTQKAIANSKKNVNKSLNNAKNNVKKSVANSKNNVKKSVANSKKNIKKSTANAKKNVKKSTSNAMKNLKKNIGRLFGKK